MTALGNLLGLSCVVAGAALPAWREPLYAVAAAGLALAIGFSHRRDSPGRNRIMTWLAALVALGVASSVYVS